MINEDQYFESLNVGQPSLDAIADISRLTALRAVTMPQPIVTEYEEAPILPAPIDAFEFGPLSEDEGKWYEKQQKKDARILEKLNRRFQRDSGIKKENENYESIFSSWVKNTQPQLKKKLSGMSIDKLKPL